MIKLNISQRNLINGAVHIKDFGAVGDGIIDDTLSVQEALKTKKTVIFEENMVYRITETIILENNIVGNNSTLISNLDKIIHLSDCNNIRVENLKIISEHISKNESTLGVITAMNKSLNNITFENIQISCSQSNINALKFVNEHDKIAKNINFINCRFNGVRMAFELQNHSKDKIYRFKNINIKNCYFSGGYGVSLSGNMENVVIETSHFKDCHIRGLELVGASNSRFSNNTFQNNNTHLECSGKKPMHNNIFSNNICLDYCPSPILIYNNTNLILTNNTFLTNDSIKVRHCSFVLLMNSIIKTKGVYGIYIESITDDFTIKDCIIDNSQSNSNFSVLRTYGNVSNVNIINSRITKGKGGVYNDALKAAEPISFFRTKKGSTMYTDSYSIKLNEYNNHNEAINDKNLNKEEFYKLKNDKVVYQK